MVALWVVMLPLVATVPAAAAVDEGRDSCERTQSQVLLQNKVVQSKSVSGASGEVAGDGTFEAARAAPCCPYDSDFKTAWSDFKDSPDVVKSIEGGAPVVVPCGTEVQMDESVAGLAGLQVRGSVTFKEGVDITVETDHVYVCGNFTIGLPSSPHQSKVEIVLTGSADVPWYHGHPMTFGTAPFVVYGGSVSLRGAACGTTTWTRLQQTIRPDASSISNIALGRPAAQSSDGHRKWYASKGVDGSDSWKKGTSVTAEELNPWWLVEVNSSAGVGKVLLTRRSYGSSSDLSQARVGVTSTRCQVGELCGEATCSFVATHEGLQDEFDCGGLHGSMVYVQLEGTTFLALAEVEVYPHVTVGTHTVQVDEAADVAWKVGDRLMLAASGYHADETEEVTIVSTSSAHTFVVEGKLFHEHLGCDTSREGCVMAAEVAALSRNIIIRGHEACGTTCGHFMLAHTTHGFICGVEFTNLGQEGVEARYPVHIHMPGEAPEIVVKDNAVHTNIQRGIVMHGVHSMTLESNLCYNTKGHCVLFEDGVEQYNRVLRNLAVMVAPLSFGCSHIGDKNFTCPDRSDDVPNGFWIPNPNNFFDGNVGVVSGEAFRFETRHVTGLTRRKFLPEAMKVGSGGKLKGRTPLAQFSNNGAHSCLHGVGNYPKLGLKGVGMNAYVNFTAWRCFVGMSAHTGDNPPRIINALLFENTVAIRGGLPNADMVVEHTRMIARPGYTNPHMGTTYTSAPFIVNKYGKTTAEKIRGVFEVDDYTRNWARCHGMYDERALDYGGDLGDWFELFTDPAHVKTCPPA